LVKRLSDQWDFEADEKIHEMEEAQGRTFTEMQRKHCGPAPPSIASPFRLVATGMML
jgi:hypothetical protein